MILTQTHQQQVEENRYEYDLNKKDQHWTAKVVTLEQHNQIC